MRAQTILHIVQAIVDDMVQGKIPGGEGEDTIVYAEGFIAGTTRISHIAFAPEPGLSSQEEKAIRDIVRILFYPRDEDEE